MCDVTPDSSCALPSSLRAPSLARDFVTSMVCTEHARAAEAAVTLLADELVSQAVVYGAPPVSLSLRCATTEVTVEVTDGSLDVDPPQCADQEMRMLLIDKIAHSWGTNRLPTGKVVWCTVPSGALPRRRSSLPWSTPNGGPKPERHRSRRWETVSVWWS